MLQISLMAVTMLLGWRSRADLLRLGRFAATTSLHPVQAIDPFVIVFPAFPLQHHVHSAIAVTDAHNCNLFDTGEQCRRVLSD